MDKICHHSIFKPQSVPRYFRIDPTSLWIYFPIQILISSFFQESDATLVLSKIELNDSQSISNRQFLCVLNSNLSQVQCTIPFLQSVPGARGSANANSAAGINGTVALLYKLGKLGTVGAVGAVTETYACDSSLRETFDIS